MSQVQDSAHPPTSFSGGHSPGFAVIQTCDRKRVTEHQSLKLKLFSNNIVFSIAFQSLLA